VSIYRLVVQCTLAADDLDSHAGMSRPRDSVELDESRDERLVNVRVLDRVRVRVAFEQLHTHTYTHTHIGRYGNRSSATVTTLPGVGHSE